MIVCWRFYGCFLSNRVASRAPTNFFRKLGFKFSKGERTVQKGRLKIASG